MGRTVSVTAEVDLGDIDTDDLEEELKRRGGNPPAALGIAVEDLHTKREAMMRALWDRDNDKAIELLKDYLCDCLGRAAI